MTNQDSTQVLLYAEKEGTYVNAEGKEVCSLTRFAMVDHDVIVKAYTEVKGGTFLANQIKLAISGYGIHKTVEQLEMEPNKGLSFVSEGYSTLLVGAKVLEDIENLLEQKSLTD